VLVAFEHAFPALRREGFEETNPPSQKDVRLRAWLDQKEAEAADTPSALAANHWSDIMNVRELLKLLARDGWFIARSRGSHRQLWHPSKPGTVTVSGHPGDTVHPKTLKSVLRQAQLEEET
jgi:predicted RNA binding protein YcfA (HicA-like mRNA interferase family)